MTSNTINAAFAVLLFLTGAAYFLADSGFNPLLLWSVVAIKCLIIQGVFMTLIRAKTVWVALGVPVLLTIVLLALPVGG